MPVTGAVVLVFQQPLSRGKTLLPFVDTFCTNLRSRIPMHALSSSPFSNTLPGLIDKRASRPPRAARNHVPCLQVALLLCDGTRSPQRLDGLLAISTGMRHTCRGGRVNLSSRMSVDRECHFRSTYQSCIFRSINHSTVQLIFSNRAAAAADTSWKVPLFQLCTVANQTRRSCPGRGAGISLLSWAPHSACLVWSRPPFQTSNLQPSIRSPYDSVNLPRESRPARLTVVVRRH